MQQGNSPRQDSTKKGGPNAKLQKIPEEKNESSQEREPSHNKADTPSNRAENDEDVG